MEKYIRPGSRSSNSHTPASNKRMKSDIRMNEDPMYEFKCPVYKTYKANKNLVQAATNNKENQFKNPTSSYDNLAKYQKYKQNKINNIPNKKPRVEYKASGRFPNTSEVFK